jgi:O-antigen/teichoic acid export membrane protein
VLTLATGLGLSAVTAVTSFVTAPFLLRWLGVERYGAFRAASDWLGYVGLLEFGIGGALQAIFARALGRDDRAEMVAAARAGMKAYLAVAGLMAAAAAGLTIALPDLIRLPGELTSELRAGCGLYLLSLAVLPLTVFRPLAEAGQRGYLVNLLLTAQAVVVAAGSVGLAAAGWGLAGQFAAVAIGATVLSLGLAWDGLRRYPEALAGGVKADGVSRSLWRLSWPNLVFNLSSRVGLLTDNIVIAGLLGPAAVAPFYLTQRAVAVVGGQLLAVGGATWAGMIDLHFRGHQEVFVRRLAQLTRLTAVLGAGLLVPVAAWNRDLIGLWVGPAQYAGPVVTWLAAANAWMLGVLGVWGWPLNAAGLARALLPAVVTSTAINLGVSLAATAAVGPPGPLVGTAAAFLLVSWWWTLRLLRVYFGVSPGTLLRPLVRPVALAVPYGAGLVLLVEAVPAYDPGWPKWAGLLALCGWLAAAAGGYLALAWFAALPADDRAEWAGRLRGLVRRG